MGDAAAMLPPRLETSSITALLESLGEPAPKSIRPLSVTAEYHSIYLLVFDEDAFSHGRASEWILRVSGHHLPGIKTRNEVGVMKTIKDTTTVPIPAVLHYDATVNNPISHEFTILERAGGVSVDTVYDTLTWPEKQGLLKQLIDMILQLEQRSWDFIGGLAVSDDGTVQPGPVVDETFWQTADIVKYWGPAESVSTLNIGGPYPNFVAYSNAYLRRYIYMISRHESMEWLRDLIPRLEATARAAEEQAATLNDTRLVLAHRDMHFPNIMFDPKTGVITSILDWEFSGVVPAARWNPARAFLWNGKQDGAAHEEKNRLYKDFITECNQRGVLQDYTFNPLQEAYQKVLSYVRALTEVCPRGQQKDKVSDWRKSAEDGMSFLGV